jgi:hypothetical protein
MNDSAKTTTGGERSRERIMAVIVRFVLIVGISLPAAYALSIGLSDISNYLARVDIVGWMADYATLVSVPWEIVATVIVIIRWRDLPQRFWIVYCINAILAYVSFPVYRYHFGIFL